MCAALLAAAACSNESSFARPCVVVAALLAAAALGASKAGAECLIADDVETVVFAAGVGVGAGAATAVVAEGVGFVAALSLVNDVDTLVVVAVIVALVDDAPKSQSIS